MTAEPPPPSLDDDPMRAVACARPPLFELDDADGWAAALEHDGFAVIANIVAPALRAELVEQFWAEFVAACRELPEASPLARVARGDDATWPSVDAFGRKSRHAPMNLAQADFLWRLRADPAVARAFARVHGGARAASSSRRSIRIRSTCAASRRAASRCTTTRRAGVDDDAARADARSVQGAVNLFAVTAGSGACRRARLAPPRDRQRAGARGARNQLHHVPLRRDFDAAQWRASARPRASCCCRPAASCCGTRGCCRAPRRARAPRRRAARRRAAAPQPADVLRLPDAAPPALARGARREGGAVPRGRHDVALGDARRRAPVQRGGPTARAP